MATSTIERQVATLNGYSVYGEQTTYSLGIFRTEVSGSLSSSTTIASSSSYNKYICQITLTKGTWLVRYRVIYPANATGVRAMALYYGASGSEAVWDHTTVQKAAPSAGQMALANATIINIGANSVTVGIAMLQNSGSTLTISTGEILALKL